MQPKQSVSSTVLRWVLGAVVVAFLVNIVSNRLDAYWVREYGEDYPMQFVVGAVLGNPYLGWLFAVLGVLGLYTWSQLAPPPHRVVERVIESHETKAPPKPLRVTCHGLPWELDGTAPVAFCPAHQDMRILFYDGLNTRHQWTAHIAGDRRFLKCPADGGHFLQLDGEDNPMYATYDGVAHEALALIRAAQRSSTG